MFSKISELSKNITIYGLGDVAVSIVSFFLLSVYVDYLTPVDYGVFGLLGVLEVIAKIVFRFGLDGSFMRFFYDCEDDAARQRLASTIFLFLLALNGTVLVALLAVSGPFAAWLLGSRTYAAALRLMLVNTFAIGFTFIPFHVLRIERKSVIFSLMTLARSVMTIVLRLLFVISFGLGVTGLYLADVVVTAIVMAALVRWFAPLLRAVFSQQVLREALAFGLPRVPHAAAQQMLAVGDKFILKLRHVSVENIGIYSMAVSFGLTQKLFLSAFEVAWAPFYYATIREPDAAGVFRTITTYAVAVLALLSAGLAAVGRETAALMTHGHLLRPLDPRWAAVDVVIAWTSVGVFFQGVYLLTSIGLNITKRTRYYPIATMTAAGVNVALNFIWIPRHGIIGAAWANGAAYALQAVLGYVLSQRFYPIAYEWGRLFRVCAAATAAAVLGRLVPPLPPWGMHEFLSQLPDLVVRGGVVVTAFGGLLGITGFFHADELRRLGALRRRGGPPAAVGGSPDSTEKAGEIVATDIAVPEE